MLKVPRFLLQWNWTSEPDQRLHFHTLEEKQWQLKFKQTSENLNEQELCKWIYERSYIWIAEKDINLWLIAAVIHRTWAVVKLKPEKSSGLNEIKTHDHCDTGAVLYRFIVRKTIYRAPSRKILDLFHVNCHTVIVIYRKRIPLRFLLWCDDLITLGCRRILVFLSLESIRESAAPEPIGWNSESMLSESSPTKPCLRILIILLIRKLCLYSRAVLCFFSLFKLYPLR